MERAVERITAYDRKAKVHFAVEAVLDTRLDWFQEPEYRYPSEFDTWEPLRDMWEPTREDAEEHKQELIAVYEGGLKRSNSKKRAKK